MQKSASAFSRTRDAKCCRRFHAEPGAGRGQGRRAAGFRSRKPSGRETQVKSIATGSNWISEIRASRSPLRNDMPLRIVFRTFLRHLLNPTDSAAQKCYNNNVRSTLCSPNNLLYYLTAPDGQSVRFFFCKANSPKHLTNNHKYEKNSRSCYDHPKPVP